MTSHRGVRTRPQIAALALGLLLVSACSGAPEAGSHAGGPSMDVAAPTQAPAGLSPGSSGTDGDEEPSETDGAGDPGEPGGPGGPGEPTQDPGPTATGVPDITLTVVVDPLGAKHPEAEAARSTAHLFCRGTQALVGSDVPDPQAACAYAMHRRGLMAAPGTAQSCTEIYGGDAVATVTGTVRAKTVNRQYSLRNGCEMSTWEAAASLVGDPGDPHAME